MTPLFLSIATLCAGLTATGMDHAPLDALLSHYVEDGLVDYAALKKDRAGLDGYLEEGGRISRSTFNAWSRNDQLAFLINVYNASTLQLIIDHFPVATIKSIGSLFSGPWDKKSVRLFGKSISLNTLEHKIIRKDYKEPRIHFALVCAALGCPPLRGEAYQGDRLDAQLEEQTQRFLNSENKNYLDRDKKTLWLSPIFKWYREDFEVAADSLPAFVAPYMLPTENAVNLKDFDISFTDYDWALNDRNSGSL